MFVYSYVKEISQSCIMKIKEGTFLELKPICYRFTHCAHIHKISSLPKQ